MAQVVMWHLLQNQLPLSVDLQWALSSLCLALQQPCVWNKLSTPEYNTHTCSLIYCLHHTILAGENTKTAFCKCDPMFYLLFRKCLLNVCPQWLYVLVTSFFVQRR